MIDNFYGETKLLRNTEALQNRPQLLAMFGSLQRYSYVNEEIYNVLVDGFDRLVHIQDLIEDDNTMRTIKTKTLAYCIYKKLQEDIIRLNRASESGSPRTQVELREVLTLFQEILSETWTDIMASFQTDA